nr:hypothetical protein Iba_scaffold30427CG0010 [Ipomoea batatas]GME21569.1 hypothetical protein Iba_scaffold28322CG0010 [Ipomoea batatas]
MQGSRWASLSASRFHEECSGDVNSKKFPYLLDGNETTSSSTSVSGEGGEWQRGIAAAAEVHVFSSLTSLSNCEATNLHLRRAWSSSPGDLQAAVDSGNHDGRLRRCAGFRSASGGQ